MSLPQYNSILSSFCLALNEPYTIFWGVMGSNKNLMLDTLVVSYHAVFIILSGGGRLSGNNYILLLIMIFFIIYSVLLGGWVWQQD